VAGTLLTATVVPLHRSPTYRHERITWDLLRRLLPRRHLLRFVLARRLLRRGARARQRPPATGSRNGRHGQVLSSSRRAISSPSPALTVSVPAFPPRFHTVTRSWAGPGSTRTEVTTTSDRIILG